MLRDTGQVPRGAVVDGFLLPSSVCYGDRQIPTCRSLSLDALKAR
jgi:hypothetical protein